MSKFQHLQEKIQQRKYIRNIEIYKSYDFISNQYYTNLILTLTNDDVFYEDKLRIRFQNISDLQTDNLAICSMIQPFFVLYDLKERGFSPESRYKLVDEEHQMLAFFFEKAEIVS